MRRVVGALRSPAVKWAFLAIALAFAVWFVARNWTGISTALRDMPAWTLGASLGASVVYVALTLVAWRTILKDLGHPLGLGPSTALFGLSQLGKYIPGGVWNIAAAADLGLAHRIPARRSVAAMSVAVLISMVSGVAVGAVGFLVAPTPALAEWAWVMWFGVPLLVLLLPPVMNRLLALVWRAMRLAPLDTSFSTAGIGAATLWSVLAWIAAGLSVGFLAVGLGAPLTAATWVQSTGGYALAWVAGFVVVFAPAGAGVREVVLAAALAGALPAAAAVALVLVSRVLLTVVDLCLAGAGVLVARAERRRLGAP
ncbi:lysylphosphatidylglycerol synthase domain-containing protein [Microbacterium betulae]|uniref:Lysylphosphatidylglycerol synthase domain-containing protein n=1 Tax=Microbacterium betulae TaxID=2981139 RepID=A0AA97I7E8_9MICO|nr:lysylphosphatidylglycerol synthase domain-containing protein [Microbacterium sp. AB]WOF24177.1 lysylphosphatidylglycerol synthase domain-containing protein [Microbacterium sp. AB]